MKDKNVIVKVWTNKKADQKLVTIPKKCNIEDGDYVQLTKIKMR